MSDSGGTSLTAKEAEDVAKGAATTELAEGEPSEALADHLFTDSFLIGIGSTMTIQYVGGGSLLAGFGIGLLSGLGLGVLAHVCMQTALDRRETLAGKILGWTVTMAVATAVWWFVATPQLALSMGGAGLAWTYGRTLLKHRTQDRKRRVEQLKRVHARRLEAGEDDDADIAHTRRASWVDRVDDVPDELVAALDALPRDLPDEVDAIVAAALDNYGHLREVLTEATIVASPVDNEAMLAEAEATLITMARRAPIVAKVMALAERRAGDSAAAKAAVVAIDGFRRHADALDEAASAAIQYAATESREDARNLREHAENLRLLMLANDELAEL